MTSPKGSVMRRLLPLVVLVTVLAATGSYAEPLGADASARESGFMVLLGSGLFGLAALLRLVSRRKA